MQFGIRRLDRDNGQPDRYHLYDSTGMLVLVADQRIHESSDERHRAVFTRPAGEQVASLDLARNEEEARARGKKGQRSYAVIINHAVYAIINVHKTAENDSGPRWYFTLEVEGEQWLVLGHQPQANDRFAIYNEIPGTLTIYDELSQADLPEPVGFIERPAEGHDFVVEILPGQFRQTALVTLALVFLIARIVNET